MPALYGHLGTYTALIGHYHIAHHTNDITIMQLIQLYKTTYKTMLNNTLPITAPCPQGEGIAIATGTNSPK